MAAPIFTATCLSLLFLAIESSCWNGFHPTAALRCCQSFLSRNLCAPNLAGGSELVLLAVSVAEGSGVHRPAPILSGRFRPCRKGSGPENAKQISQPSPFFPSSPPASIFSTPRCNRVLSLETPVPCPDLGGYR